MNVYLFDLILKWVGVLFVSLASFLGIYKEDTIVTENTNKNMSLNMTTEIIAHGTKIQYNSSKPNGERSIITPGEDGYVVKNNANGIQKIMKNPVDEVIEVGTFVSKPTGESYVGKMTMYYNCPTSPKCPTSSGYDLNKGIQYADKTYGTIRILSAARTKFPHGTIIEVSGTPMGTFLGIVLDNGGDMNSAWVNGKVHIDLAVDALTEKARTYQEVSFNVKRWGY